MISQRIEGTVQERAWLAIGRNGRECRLIALERSYIVTYYAKVLNQLPAEVEEAVQARNAEQGQVVVVEVASIVVVVVVEEEVGLRNVAAIG